MGFASSSRVALLAILVGCSTPLAPLPPPPQGVREIAVSQPVNATGQELLVSNPGMLGRVIGEETATVPDALASDLRTLLADRGFRLVAGNTGDAPDLRTQITRWKLYTADYSSVTVDLTASLVDPKSGRELWTARRTAWPVQTPNARSGLESSASAARTIARALIEGWQPAAIPQAGLTSPRR